MSNTVSPRLIDIGFVAATLFMYGFNIIPFRAALLWMLMVIALRRY